MNLCRLCGHVFRGYSGLFGLPMNYVTVRRKKPRVDLLPQVKISVGGGGAACFVHSLRLPLFVFNSLSDHWRRGRAAANKRNEPRDDGVVHDGGKSNQIMYELVTQNLPFLR